MDFQDVIMRLDHYWAEKGCLIWQPYNVQVGAGTWNPATALRVLGPEPWNVAYVEPSVRPADGRYGKNPNRWGQYYQYQVILKPDPGNPVELYLDSLQALGIDRHQHDIRLVEDNWESPGLGAWGLGWEIWMDGQEITQFTYFQQTGGFDLAPVSVEITYGLERIVMVLQGARDFAHIRWGQGITYGDMLLRQEMEHCTYNFEVADIARLAHMYDLFENEARAALSRSLVIPAHDYVLKCSHVFNLLDARGAVGVTERARYFSRMRDLSRQVAAAYLAQREEMGYPMCRTPSATPAVAVPDGSEPASSTPAELLIEIGCEELPVADLDAALGQLRESVPQALNEARLSFDEVRVSGTPRRLVVHVRGLAAAQAALERVIKGPPAERALDEHGQPSKAAIGFAKAQGLAVADLQRRDFEGKTYVVAVKSEPGRAACTVLSDAIPPLIASLHFPKVMRWNESGVAFSRPVRWIVALLGDQVIPFEYASVKSGRITHGSRPQGSQDLVVQAAGSYLEVMSEHSVMVDPDERRAYISGRAAQLAESVGGYIPDDEQLLREVSNLVEWPVPLLGRFPDEYLELPQRVLVAAMKKHQRYFPVMRDGEMLPYFVAVANGPYEDLALIQHGNEEVLRARYADAAFFYQMDMRKKLEDFLPRLNTLTFQEQLGSVRDKVTRMERLVGDLVDWTTTPKQDREVAARAAQLCKADLATQMVVELTSLQGHMGAHYALRSGEPEAVAQAIEEHYLPRNAGDSLPTAMPGVLVGLADRLDSIAGLFAVGHAPSGSADPYGLRRAALGLVQILAEKHLSLSVRRALRAAGELLPVRLSDEQLTAAWDFVVQRMRAWALDLGFRYDLVDAVLAASADDPYLALKSLRQLSNWASQPEFSTLLTAYSRPSRIVRDQAEHLPLDVSKLSTEAERGLYKAVTLAEEQRASVSDIDALMTVLGPLVAPIDAFFRDVFVMVEDETVRTNRLALLQRIAVLPGGIVDLTKVLGY